MTAPYSIRAKDLLDYLREHCQGRPNAQPIREIAAALCMDRRECEMATEALRKAGIALCSSCVKPMGLFIALTYAEMEPWVRQIDHRFRTMAINRAKAVEQLKAIAQNEGIQMSFEIMEDAYV